MCRALQNMHIHGILDTVLKVYYNYEHCIVGCAGWCCIEAPQIWCAKTTAWVCKEHHYMWCDKHTPPGVHIWCARCTVKPHQILYVSAHFISKSVESLNSIQLDSLYANPSCRSTRFIIVLQYSASRLHDLTSGNNYIVMRFTKSLF